MPSDSYIHTYTITASPLTSRNNQRVWSGVINKYPPMDSQMLIGKVCSARSVRLHFVINVLLPDVCTEYGANCSVGDEDTCSLQCATRMRRNAARDTIAGGEHAARIKWISNPPHHVCSVAAAWRHFTAYFNTLNSELDRTVILETSLIRYVKPNRSWKII
jgi:hypothetical protein